MLQSRTGHIIVGTNGTDRLRIESGGNVGIGTDNPGALLQLRKDAAGSLPLLQLSSHAGAAGGFTDNYCVEFRHASSGVTHGMLVSNNEAADARRTLDIADTNGIFATFTNGKFGVGVTSPATKLDVRPTAEDPTTGSPAAKSFLTNKSR